MDFLDLLRTMARRWYVVTPVLLLTAVGVYRLAVTTEPSYEANGMFILTQPGLVPGALADGSVVIPDPTGSIASLPALAALMGSDAARAELSSGSSATYDVVPVSGTDLLEIRVRGPEPDEVVPLLERVVASIEGRVEDVAQVVPAPSAPRKLPQGQDGPAWFTASTVVSVPSLAGSGGNAMDASFTGRLLSEMMADPAAQREVLSEELDGTYEFSQDGRDPGPFLELTATSSSPRSTLDLFDRAAEVASERLATLQSNRGSSSTSRMVLQPLRRPPGAQLLSGGRTRPLVTLAGLGGLAAFSLALLVEALAGRRRREDPPARAAGGVGEALGPAFLATTGPTTVVERREGPAVRARQSDQRSPIAVSNETSEVRLDAPGRGSPETGRWDVEPRKADSPTGARTSA